jgi:hypothetical protein
MEIVWTFNPLLEIEWILVIHNNCIFPYYGYGIEIVWIYYGFSRCNCKFHSMDFTFFARKNSPNAIITNIFHF